MAGRARIASAVVLGMAICITGCQGCEQPETALNNLEFWAVDKNAQHLSLLDSRLTLRGQSYGWGKNQLTPALTGAALSQVQVRFKGATERSETHLFAFDPAERAAQLRLLVAQERANPDPVEQFPWDELFQDPKNAGKVTLPHDVVLPFPNKAASEPAPYEPLSDRSELLLAASQFAWTWPGQPPNVLAGDAAAPGGTGSVKAARVYDHGACSHVESIQDRLETEVDGALARLDQTLAAQGLADKVTPDLHFLRAAVFLDHGDPTDPSDFRDGLFIDAHLTLKAPPGHPDYDVWAFLEARFTLDPEGFITLDYTTMDVQVSHGCCVALVENDTIKGYVEEALLQIRDNLVEEELTRQHADLPVSMFGTCNPKAADPCKDAIFTMQQLIGFGSDNINSVRPPGDPERLSSSDVAALQTLVEDRASWSCPVRRDGAATCHYYAPVKRFNIYPDEVEAVLFDEKEIKNPAYALWVALQIPDVALQPARENMCNWNPTHASEMFYPRPFAWTSR